MQSGIVNNLWTKEVKTRNGPAPVNLCSLEGDDKVYNLGFGKAPIQEGDKINFNYEGPKYGEYHIDKQTLKIESRGNPVSDKSKPEPASSGVQAGGSGSGLKNTSGSYSRGNFPLDFKDGQRSILRQHAFTQARESFEYFRAEVGRGEEETPEEYIDSIIKLAYKIERYTSGDDLREEMNNGNE